MSLPEFPVRALLVPASVIFCLLVTASAWASGAEDLAQGNAAISAGDRAAARVAFESAAASEDVEVSAQAIYFLANMDDEDLLFDRALERYRASVARSPSHRYAPRALARADLLRHHAEGEFEPYVHLERVRRDPRLANDAKEIDALARQAATFPPGLVRVEARMLAAEAYLGRLGRPDDGIQELRLVVSDPASDALTTRQAERELVDALVSKDDLAGAAEAARAKGVDAKLAKYVTTIVRRRALHRGAVALLVAFALLAGARVGRSAARFSSALPAVRAWSKLTVLFVAWLALFGGMLASQYESGNAAPFFVFGAVVSGISVIARTWGALGSPRRAARAGRAVVTSAGIFAAAFLVLESLDTKYLEGFGL